MCKEIKMHQNTSKKNESFCIGKYMAITQRMLNAFLRYRLSDTDITPSMFMFLLNLLGEDGISQKQLNDSMQYDKGVVARLASQLEIKGYIDRKSNAEDHRAYRLYLTEKAREMQPKIIEILAEWNSVLLDEETNETKLVLNSALERISQRGVKKVKEIKNG